MDMVHIITHTEIVKVLLDWVIASSVLQHPAEGLPVLFKLSI